MDGETGQTNAPKHPFVYVKPNEVSVADITRVREACSALYDLLHQVLPNCRERALAITNLEQTSMWANKGIVFCQAESTAETVGSQLA